jgi:hypothetical protein
MKIFKTTSIELIFSATTENFTIEIPQKNFKHTFEYSIDIEEFESCTDPLENESLHDLASIISSDLVHEFNLFDESSEQSLIDIVIDIDWLHLINSKQSITEKITQYDFSEMN